MTIMYNESCFSNHYSTIIYSNANLMSEVGEGKY